MIIDIITLFPDLFLASINNGNIKKAISQGSLNVNLVDLKKFGIGKYKKVDDSPAGGLEGQVLRVDVVHAAILSVKRENQKVILFSPQGKVLKQKTILDWDKNSNYIFICGHYEGIDERIKNFVDYEISIGEYILSGGELPALVLLDALSRSFDGILNVDSFNNDSFSDGKIKYPVYTKPNSYLDLDIPEVLLSGNHQKIKEFNEKNKQSANINYSKKNNAGELD